MITVHYLNNSRAHRIIWLLEELQLEYKNVKYARDEDMRAPLELKNVHPLGKSPVIEDSGFVYAESGAIIQYLIEAYGAGFLRPNSDRDENRLYRYWIHYSEGSAMTPLLLKLLFAKLPQKVPFLIRPFAKLISKGALKQYVDPQLEEHINYWETELSKTGMFAGAHFTGADVAMSFPVEVAMERYDGDGRFKAIRQYLENIRSRPAYQKALEIGGAYSFSES